MQNLLKHDLFSNLTDAMSKTSILNVMMIRASVAKYCFTLRPVVGSMNTIREKKTCQVDPQKDVHLWQHCRVCEPRTAGVWIEQAEADLKALRVLLAKIDTIDEVCCHICFLAHEVAEKALKAGKYAVCGLDPGS